MKPKYARLLLTVCLFALSVIAHAQYGAQVSYIKPSGTFGYLFKPTVQGEFLVQSGEIDDRLRLGFSIGYYELTARQDTFFSYGLKNGSTYLPAYTIWESYKAVPIALTTDFRILLEHRLSPVIGLDLVGTLVDYSYVSELSTVIHKTEQSGTATMAVIPRIGVQFDLTDNVLISTCVGKSFGRDMKSGDGTNIWKMQVALIYFPD